MKPNETNRAECITDEQRWTQCPCYGPSHGMDHLTKTLLRLPEEKPPADISISKLCDKAGGRTDILLPEFQEQREYCKNIYQQIIWRFR